MKRRRMIIMVMLAAAVAGAVAWKGLWSPSGLHPFVSRSEENEIAILVIEHFCRRYRWEGAPPKEGIRVVTFGRAPDPDVLDSLTRDLGIAARAPSQSTAETAFVSVRGLLSLLPFSDRARLRLRAWCGVLCGEGVSYRLTKKSGKWRIDEEIVEWVS